MFEIEYYRLASGRAPVEDFIASLGPKMQAKAIWSLELLAEYGNQLREPYSKAIEDGPFELRIKFAGDITRIFYFFVWENKIILTNGFIKKTAKTPKVEIELARQYRADYERRLFDERSSEAKAGTDGKP